MTDVGLSSTPTLKNKSLVSEHVRAYTHPMRIVTEGTTKNGTPYTIRYPEIADVESAWRYINRLSKERTFVRVQGEEVTLEEEQKFITKLIEKVEVGKAAALFLIVNGEVHGLCNIEMQDKTESHIAKLGLGVDAASRGQGFGRLLMETTIDEAKKLEGLQKIILTVKAPNSLAKSLYEKLGFVEFGMLPKGTRHQGELVDSHHMYIDL